MPDLQQSSNVAYITLHNLLTNYYKRICLLLNSWPGLVIMERSVKNG